MTTGREALKLRSAARRALERSRTGQALLAVSRRRRAINFYQNFLDPHSLCFDIGGNLGARAELFRTIGARTLVVEPQSACVRELRAKFADDPEVTIAAVAVGSSPGTAEIAICEEDPTISTMAAHWQTEGRFAEQAWSKSESVQVTTLDRLIDEHGKPTFCKIDVEGFERQVLEGLTSPIDCVSFEFTHEFLEEARICTALLADIGPIITNVSIGESMQLLGGWVDPASLFETLQGSPDALSWGDIYVRSLGARRP